MRPVLSHTSCLQKMTTFYDFDYETDSAGKTQHILCCLDQLIPNPQCKAEESSSGDPKHRDLSVFLLPDHCDQLKLGEKLMTLGNELSCVTHDKVRVVHNKESYFRLVFGKNMVSFKNECPRTDMKKIARKLQELTQKKIKRKVPEPTQKIIRRKKPLRKPQRNQSQRKPLQRKLLGRKLLQRKLL